MWLVKMLVRGEILKIGQGLIYLTLNTVVAAVVDVVVATLFHVSSIIPTSTPRPRLYSTYCIDARLNREMQQQRNEMINLWMSFILMILITSWQMIREVSVKSSLLLNINYHQSVTQVFCWWVNFSCCLDLLVNKT